MPEAEIRLGKACRTYFRPFAGKTANEKEVTEVTLGGHELRAASLGQPAISFCSRLEARSLRSPPPDTANSVPSVPDSPGRSRKGMRHPPGIRSSRAAAARGAPTGGRAAWPASPKPRPGHASRSLEIRW